LLYKTKSEELKVRGPTLKLREVNQKELKLKKGGYYLLGRSTKKSSTQKKEDIIYYYRIQFSNFR